MDDFEVIAEAGFRVGDTHHVYGALIQLNSSVGEWAVGQGYVRKSTAKTEATATVAAPPAPTKPRK
jgi:hypothetical protein